MLRSLVGSEMCIRDSINAEYGESLIIIMAAKCPFAMDYMARVADKPTSLNLKVLQPTRYLDDFDYPTEFAKLDLAALKQDMIQVLTTSQEWWPADYGHYGPLMIRLAWHSAGTYRTVDGRGGANSGNMRFAPLNSWPDNGNLDKARRLLWPLKQKYGRSLSWGDLMIFAGNCAMESMGCEPFGFAGGRVDCWAPEEDVYWGPESEWMGDERHGDGGVLEEPLGADHMGLIYVNPEGPGGNPDPVAAGVRIRETFGRMAMGDEETVALIAGGHTFGKGHGAADPGVHVGPEPMRAGIEEQGLGWKNGHGSGKGGDTITSGLEGAWTANPAAWDHGFFENLFKWTWELGKGPGGAHQWYPKEAEAAGLIPDAHDPDKRHTPMMFTTDLALLHDPAYAVISKRFLENPDQFKQAYTRAWYKLTHRDMGPHPRCLGSLVPEPQIWQDPVPEGAAVSDDQAVTLKAQILAKGLPVSALVKAAWASAATYRATDHRGGTNGARVRLTPQNQWQVNDPEELAQVLGALEEVRAAAEAQVSMADLIVLGGCAAIEQAAKAGGHEIAVPFKGGRGDATDDQTDAASFEVLEPKTDGFRNFRATPHQLVDRAHLLSLTAPEMSVLLAGLRSLGANSAGSKIGVLTSRPGVLSNDFFINLLEVGTSWSQSPECEHVYEGRGQGGVEWQASSVDLVFGSNAELRAIAEYYSCADSQELFARDFVAAWAKVMDLDRC
eukprot:TRINITY_DN13652_c0_g1_i4.p1 TRINITY_DN13652_c0_g1~~TRINITY_DN13652_c0_g1_i4.p1  ORF type:complete len:725 (-),score=205.06 TRINITY_DN13652_c0_g1_i4:522-2696(-)